MNHKRADKRFKVNDLEITATVMFAWDVKVIDVGLGGISLESTRLLNLGNSYPLRLKDKEKAIALKGNVVWSSLTGSRRTPCGDVIPVYRVGMNFVGISHEKSVEILNFIQENHDSCVYNAHVAVRESGPGIPGKFLDTIEHKYKWHKSIEYCKTFGITEYPWDERSKETDYALAREFQPDCSPGGSSVDLMGLFQSATNASGVSLTRLFVPRQVEARAGRAVTLYARAVAASTAGEVPVTVTLKVVPVAGVRVGIYPASIRKELDGPTNFCFSPRIVCTESGTWQVKWTAKISSSKDGNTSNDALTGTTQIVCRSSAK